MGFLSINNSMVIKNAHQKHSNITFCTKQHCKWADERNACYYCELYDSVTNYRSTQVSALSSILCNTAIKQPSYFSATYYAFQQSRYNFSLTMSVHFDHWIGLNRLLKKTDQQNWTVDFSYHFLPQKRNFSLIYKLSRW